MEPIPNQEFLSAFEAMTFRLCEARQRVYYDQWVETEKEKIEDQKGDDMVSFKEKERYDIFQSFLENTKKFGELILFELNEDNNSKLIQQSAVGGIAGGKKFIVKSILFKVAADTQVSSKSIYLYGGTSPSVENAMKGHIKSMRLKSNSIAF
jgi:hypothetical protein